MKTLLLAISILFTSTLLAQKQTTTNKEQFYIALVSEIAGYPFTMKVKNSAFNDFIMVKLYLSADGKFTYHDGKTLEQGNYILKDGLLTLKCDNGLVYEYKYKKLDEDVITLSTKIRKLYFFKDITAFQK